VGSRLIDETWCNMPAVSVLMPVYNGENYVREAIEGILGQTCRDFEFLIINDGSNDGSAQIIASYADLRIRVISNDVNRGLVYSLNRGLDAARGN
jgi:glycosyltransferase involved in cell wall biosynthesis